MTHSEKGKQILAELVDLFTKGDLPIVDYMAKGKLFTSIKPSTRWSYGNQLLMLLQGTTDARGYKQWLQSGRAVKKGAKAIYILRPLIAKRTEEKNGKIEEITFVHGFAGLPVFRIEDTDITDAAKWEESNKLPVPNQMPLLSGVAKSWNIAVMYDASTGGEYGSYNPTKDEIRLCTEDQSVFFHELGHAAHKKIDGKLKGGQHIDQELIAEFSAAIIARVYGMNYDKFAYTYIAKYVGNGKVADKAEIGAELMKVLAKVEKVVDLILGTKDQLDKEQQEAIAVVA